MKSTKLKILEVRSKEFYSLPPIVQLGTVKNDDILVIRLDYCKKYNCEIIIENFYRPISTCIDE